MGFVFGAISALCFAVGSILFKIGQRTRPHDDGHLVANFLNAALFGVLALLVTWQPWNTAGFVGLVVGGVLGTVFGRFALLRGIRLVGPTRGNTFQTATPIPAAIAGWIVLGENVAPLEAAGGAVTLSGLVRIVRSRGTDADGGRVPLSHYLIAAGAPAFFGIAFVARKWGLERLPGSVTGAFIGSAAGFVVLLAWEAGRGRLPGLVRTMKAEPPLAYFAAGLVTSAALLTQFLALERVEAWIVGILGATTAIWTPFLSVAFLGQDEPITVSLLVNIALVFGGVVIIAAVG